VGSLNRFLIFVFAAIGCLGGVGVAQAAFPGENGRIAFERYSASSGSSVTTLAPDATGASTLLGGAISPAWSPDGTKVALRASDAQTSRSTIHVINADGSGLMNVGPPPEDPEPANPRFVDNPTWSPDGTRIAYEKNEVICAHSCVIRPLGIFTIATDGSDETQLTGGGHNPSWSPDGNNIAYDTSNGFFPGGDILVVNADGSGQDNLTETTGSDEREPNWSPDGTKIVFARGWLNLGEGDIDVIRSDGTPLGSLVGGPTVDRMPAWSPDGTEVVFRSERDGGGLYTVNAAGTDVVRLAASGADDYDPDWQPLVGPRREDFKNSAQFCKAERQFLGDAAFAARYGGGANAHGRCVSRKN
jgi:Tol biopolymer transport system component